MLCFPSRSICVSSILLLFLLKLFSYFSFVKFVKRCSYLYFYYYYYCGCCVTQAFCKRRAQIFYNSKFVSMEWSNGFRGVATQFKVERHRLLLCRRRSKLCSFRDFILFVPTLPFLLFNVAIPFSIVWLPFHSYNKIYTFEQEALDWH